MEEDAKFEEDVKEMIDGVLELNCECDWIAHLLL